MNMWVGCGGGGRGAFGCAQCLACATSLGDGLHPSSRPSATAAPLRPCAHLHEGGRGANHKRHPQCRGETAVRAAAQHGDKAPPARATAARRPFRGSARRGRRRPGPSRTSGRVTWAEGRRGRPGPAKLRGPAGLGGAEAQAAGPTRGGRPAGPRTGIAGGPGAAEGGPGVGWEGAVAAQGAWGTPAAV